MKYVLIGCGAIVGLALLGVLAAAFWYGLNIERGVVPDTTIIPGNKLSSAAKDAIAKAITLRDAESIRYFYSTGMMSWEEDGNIITNQRVVSYFQDGDDFYVDEADYTDIVEVQPNYSDTWIEDSILTIVMDDGYDFFLCLSIEGGLDRSAIEYVERQVADAHKSRAREDAPPPEPADRAVGP